MGAGSQCGAERQRLGELLADSFLADAPIVHTSTETGAGLEDLRQALTDILDATSERSGPELTRLLFLIDCTSMGLDEASEAKIPAPIPLDAMPVHGIVSTLVYHRETQLLSEAARLGRRTLDGAGMLLFQGAEAFEIWTGQEAPIAAMRTAFQDASD